MRNQIRRFDVTFVVDEPDAMRGQDLCDIGLLISLLDDAGYEVRAIGSNENNTLFVQKRKELT